MKPAQKETERAEMKPAQVTEVHYLLAHKVMTTYGDESYSRAAQLIADSEAKAVEVYAKAHTEAVQSCGRMVAERDQIRCALETCRKQLEIRERIGNVAEAELAVANASIVSSLVYNTLKERLSEVEKDLANQKVQNNHNWQFQEISEAALKRAEKAEERLHTLREACKAVDYLPRIQSALEKTKDEV